MRRQSNAAASTSERSPFYEPDAPDTCDGAAKEGAAEQQHGFKTPPHELNSRWTPRSTLDSIPSLIPSDINLPEQVQKLNPHVELQWVQLLWEACYCPHSMLNHFAWSI